MFPPMLLRDYLNLLEDLVKFFAKQAAAFAIKAYGPSLIGLLPISIVISFKLFNDTELRFLGIALFYLPLYALLYYLKDRAIANYSKFCKYEPCNEPVSGVKCYRASFSHALKCLQRLEGELGIDVEVTKCGKAKRKAKKFLIKALEKALDELSQGDLNSARKILKGVKVCEEW